jgi:N-carbamoyl-L-amino-acid hydrolase
MSLEPSRTLRELAELAELTSDLDGAQRVAFTPTWNRARAWAQEKILAAGFSYHRDPAGNAWATLPGKSTKELLLGGHIDSVPNGGWLDGSLGLLAGLEVMRYLNEIYQGQPPLTVKLVDWADEEGARFGRSLLGSSAAAGRLDIGTVSGLQDHQGVTLKEALATCGLELAQAGLAQKELAQAGAYLELHIEQGPVLEQLGLPLGAVLGTYGVERHTLTFKGQAAHSGSTPMELRRDAFLAAGQMASEIYQIAARHGGVCTIGSCTTAPGIVTSVVETCTISLDQRHLDPAHLAAMWQEAQAAAQQLAQQGGLGLETGLLWQIEPLPFHPDLIALAQAAIQETVGQVHSLPSGPLHDAASMVQAKIPTTMLFVQSLKGISHNKIENSRPEHLEAAVTALAKLAQKTLHWLENS